MIRRQFVLVAAVLASVLLLGPWVSPASAITVTPSSNVTKYVVVRKQPSAQSADLAHLNPGDTAETLASVPRWYKVELPNGIVGFVNKGWVVEITGATPPPPGGTPVVPPLGGGAMSFRPVSAVAAIPHSPPDAGAYRIHLIDVGTGLAVLVQGHDWNLLYDGGSNDPSEIGPGKDRLLAYLFAALGPSGPAECVPPGDPPPAHATNPEITIQQVFASHPHQDHAVFLDDVLHCYAVDNVWESGAINDAAFYLDFTQAVAAEPSVAYHTATAVPASRTRTVNGTDVVFPASVTWTTFAEGETGTLDANAHFAILHVDPTTHISSFGNADPNFNSVVVRVDLGGRSLLLTGDTTNGTRQPHTTQPVGAEKDLVDHHAADIDVDILQVAHHGSQTSTRKAFLDAVSPSIALIGCGPKKYGSVVLPDADVVAALKQSGATVLRTDDSDKNGCGGDRVGLDDTAPGGCDNWIIDIAP